MGRPKTQDITGPAHRCLVLMHEFEKDRQVSDVLGDDRSRTPAGDPYLTFQGLGGEDGARAAFAEYAKDRKGVLHWRVLPEIRTVGSYDELFYFRLFIDP